jgi:hypothetical protein
LDCSAIQEDEEEDDEEEEEEEDEEEEEEDCNKCSENYLLSVAASFMYRNNLTHHHTV